MGRFPRRFVLAALAAVAGPGGGLAGPARAADSGTGTDTPDAGPEIPSPSGLPLTGGPEFPIGLFWPPHPYASTLARYTEIADAGFTFIISGNYAADGNIFKYQLGLADRAGLKMLISDDIQIANMSRWFRISDDPAVNLSVTPAEATQLYLRAKNAYGSHASLAGFNHYDEPGSGWFPTLARVFQIARASAPGLLPYVNLSASTDPAYYQGFVNTVKPSLISFDHYPLLSSGTEDANYFLNWAVVRKAALSAAIPAWVFIQSVSYDGHRTPTAADLLWQINVSLAYSAKGIQYFTYWTPDPGRGQNFGPALITVDGERTPLYDAARTINTTWLRSVGRQLKPLVNESVVHANDTPLPKGAVAFAPDHYLHDVTGQAVIIGSFRGTRAGERLVLVANRSPHATADATVTVQKSTVATIELFDPATGAYVPADNPARLHVVLEPGAATLARLRGK